MRTVSAPSANSENNPFTGDENMARHLEHHFVYCPFEFLWLA
jgi:hypothetical protein